MMSDRLSELLLRWEELQEQGRPARPEDLCRDCPELLDPLRRQIEALRALSPALETEAVSPHDGTAEATRPVSPSAIASWPTVVGYEVEGVLGRGGMGVVYKARQLRLNRVVALKMILSGSHAGPRELARFQAEAEAIACLQHPNIVQIHEVGQSEGHPYFSLEFVDGGSLERKLQGMPQPPREAARLVAIIARAMHAAHEKGIVHRDLKPSNVLLAADGTPKVTDFGLAKKLDEAHGLTQTGFILGTPSYMAPEQAQGRTKDIGPGTDIYALGAILYECLTGRPPVLGATTMETLQQIVYMEPVPVRALQPKVPRDLETICLKALTKDPGKRYSTALSLAEDLDRFLAGEPVRARPTPPWERAIKWVRRRPSSAAALGTAALAVLVLVVLGVVYHDRLQARIIGEQQEKEKAEKALAESAERLLRLQVSSGATLMDQGDLFGSLVWFTEALRHDADHADTHRERLAAVLRQCPRLEQVCFHDGPLTQARFSPDGRLLVTASTDHTARLWDVESGAQVGQVLRHDNVVNIARFSVRGQRVVTASDDGTARVWEAPGGQQIGEPLRHGSRVLDAAFSPDGQRIATACADGTARLWDTSTGRQLNEWRHEREVNRARFSPDGKRVATASGDGTARLWDAETGKETMAEPMRHDGAVLDVGFSPKDGKRLVTASADNTARVWDAETGKEVLKLKHRASVREAIFSPDGSRVLTASTDQTARLWDAQTGCPQVPVMRHASALQHAAFSPDGKLVITGSDDNSGRVWDADTGRPVSPALTHTATVQFVAFSPDGRRVATASDDGTACIFTSLPPSYLGPSLRQRGGVLALAFSPDGRLLATASEDGTARLWDVASRQQVSLPLQHKDRVVDVAFSPDGRRVVTASTDHTARVWQTDTGRPLFASPLKHQEAVNRAQFSPDGKRVATASGDGTARVWDAETGKEVLTLRHEGAVLDAAFSPDGLRVVSAGQDDRARLWDARTGRQIAELRHDRAVLRATFSPDGRLVVTASSDTTARLWDGQTGEASGQVLQHAGKVRDAAFSQDGQSVVTASEDDTFRLWETESGKLRVPPVRMGGTVSHAGFSRDGRRVVTASDDGIGRVWDAASGEPLTPALQHRGWGQISDAVFSPDGRRVATASADGGARLWLLGRDERPVEELSLWAQLLASRKLHTDGRGLVPLDNKALRETWRLLRSRGRE